MAYTYNQLSLAYAAVHGGIEPTGEAASQLRLLTNASYSDADRLSYILNSADDTAAVAVLSYQFFTGKAPTAEGMAWLLNSPDNPGDLNDPAYARLNLENRFMNFATNLALQGEAKAAFEGQYGALPYAAYVATIYDSIIGRDFAKAAGLDPDAIIQSIIGRQDMILQSARNNGVIGPNATAAEIDLALKAATAAYLLAEGIKADIGLFAGATNNFMLAVATGKAVYGADILETYAPTPGSGGTGQPVTNPPAPEDLPGWPQPQPEPEIPPGPMTFVLTAGNDHFTGGAFDDAFTATIATLNDGDVLDGGDGDDTLTVDVFTSPFTFAAATVSNIETVNITGTQGFLADMRTWTGVQRIVTTSEASAGIRAPSGADIDATVTDAAGGSSSLNGGANVTLKISGRHSGVTYVGQSTAPTGAVAVTRTLTEATSNGDIQITGGSTVSVTQIASNPAGAAQTLGAVAIQGTDLTTAVTVKATPASANVIASTVSVTDGSASGQILRILAADGFDGLTFTGGGLETLTLAHGSGDITLDNAGASAIIDLDLTLDGVNASRLKDGGRYEILTLTTGAEASVLGAMQFGALKTLTLDGDTRLTVTDASGLTALQRVEITGDASLTADFSNATSLAEIDASAGAGDHVLTIDGRYTAYRGGAGAETLTIGPTQFFQTVAQTIEMGDGDDLMILGDMGLGVGTRIDGGAGTDTLRVSSYNAEFHAADIATHTSGFERLEISPVGVMRINLDTLGYRHVAMIDSHPIQVEIAGMRSDDTLELTSSGDDYFLTGAALTGQSDRLNLILRDDAGAGLDFGAIHAVGFETVDIQLSGTGSTSGRLELTNASLQTVVLSGDAGLQLIAESTALTSLDATGLTQGRLTWTAGAIAGDVTVKGALNGQNVIDVRAILGDATLTGGARSDMFIVGAGAHKIDLSNGDPSIGSDTVAVFGPSASSSIFTTITGAHARDLLQFQFNFVATTMAAAIDVSGAADLDAALDQASAGSGAMDRPEWFMFGGDTYVVVDRSSQATFNDGVDIVVKLVGPFDLEGHHIGASLIYL